MNKKISTLLLALVLGQAGSAFGENSVGLGYGYAGGDGVSFNSVVLDFSAKASDNIGFAVTGQYGGSDSGVDLDSFIAGKLRLGTTTAGGSFFYVTAGYGNASLSGYGASASESGGLVGAGIEVGTSGNWGYGLEFTTGVGNFDELDAGNFVIKYKF